MQSFAIFWTWYHGSAKRNDTERRSNRTDFLKVTSNVRRIEALPK